MNKNLSEKEIKEIESLADENLKEEVKTFLEDLNKK